MQAFRLQDFPSPQIMPSRCNTDFDSYICDPHQIIDPKEARQLRLLLKEVATDTRCPCSMYTCTRRDIQKYRGYKIGVALLDSLSGNSSANSQNSAYREESHDKMQDTLEEAAKVAIKLRNEWKLGLCDEDVIIVYSRADDVVYTVTGSTARETLTDRLVGGISYSARNRNDDNFGFSGIRFMIEEYHKVFKGYYDDNEPKYGAIVGSDSVSMVVTSSLLVISLLLSNLIYLIN